MPLLVLPNAYGDAATNMAVDASLLHSTPKDIAVFRHYAWMEPAITFGYTQQWAEVSALFPDDIRLCRRLTGGGIVDHRNDWTYALVIQTSLPAARTRANALYEQIHGSLAHALKRQDIQTQLAPCPRQCGEPVTSRGADQCFVQPVANDVLDLRGNKIAGAAMKRAREGLLIQGSIDRATLPSDFDFQHFAEAFVNELSAGLDLPVGQSDDIRSLFDGPLIQKERERFKSDAWTQKR